MYNIDGGWVVAILIPATDAGTAASAGISSGRSALHHRRSAGFRWRVYSSLARGCLHMFRVDDPYEVTIPFCKVRIFHDPCFFFLGLAQLGLIED